jgi:hypothetical protein
MCIMFLNKIATTFFGVVAYIMLKSDIYIIYELNHHLLNYKQVL